MSSLFHTGPMSFKEERAKSIDRWTTAATEFFERLMDARTSTEQTNRIYEAFMEQLRSAGRESLPSFAKASQEERDVTCMTEAWNGLEAVEDSANHFCRLVRTMDPETMSEANQKLVVKAGSKMITTIVQTMTFFVEAGARAKHYYQAKSETTMVNSSRRTSSTFSFLLLSPMLKSRIQEQNLLPSRVDDVGRQAVE